MDRISRIQEMEKRFNESRQAVDRLQEAFAAYEQIQKEYKKLVDYYESNRWMDDFDADEEGILPLDLPRGVLSEDGVYNLISDNHDLAVRMLKVITKALESRIL